MDSRPETVIDLEDGPGAITADVPTIIAAAQRYHRAGDLAEAEIGYRIALGREPDHPDALHLLGLLACQIGKADIGVPLIRRAIARAPDVASFHVNLGNVLSLKEDDETGAEECYRRALTLEPDNVEALINLASVVRRTDLPGALALTERAVQVAPDRGEAHFGLASTLRRLKRTEEAERHYRRALEINPDLLPVYHELARLFYAQYRFEDAASVYHAWLQIRPDDPVPRHNLAAIMGEDVPRASDGFIRKIFDGFAPSFDRKLEFLEYRAPSLIGAALAEIAPAEAAALDILDVGCGTGLCGAEVRGRARRLDGVDLSEGMLAKARERGIYDTLALGELTAFLMQQTPNAYDIAVSGDTLVYFGPLEAVFAGAARVVRPGGYFLFTLERLDDPGADHRLMPYGRYRHAPSYVAAALAKAGFACELSDVVLRKEALADVEGLLAVAHLSAG
jgi:predicted TPR repeat methyltransferase